MFHAADRYRGMISVTVDTNSMNTTVFEQGLGHMSNEQRKTNISHQSVHQVSAVVIHLQGLVSNI